MYQTCLARVKNEEASAAAFLKLSILKVLFKKIGRNKLQR